LTDDIATETEQVRTRLTQVRKQRMDAQRRAADRTTVAMALQRTSRDRSALSSPDVETERARGQKLFDELADLYAAADHTRALLDRVKASGQPADSTQLDSRLAAEATTRAERAELAARHAGGADRG
jgi:hypothetical protein